MATNTSNTPAICVITARIKQTRNRAIKSFHSFDKTDYSSLERELISCLRTNYDVTHFSDTDTTDWPLSNSPSFPARMFARGHVPITNSKSVDFLSNTFSFGKDLDILQQFMRDNSHIERYIINIFAKDATQIKSDYMTKFFNMVSSSKSVVFYFCRKATRKMFQKEYWTSLCGLLQFSIRKYILDFKEKHPILDTNKLTNHINSYLKG
ncbi:hypothetical protein LOD99_2792 [Oopsacas minuta]|uniref:Uncharacterized protein n=1 Tax=Oopsacas minuta TaxID=111878 RepID=A0AAV7K119_9METZ|nr:hypothetical protein LOD99_2792 [Oopsacas minuta]